MQVADSTGEIEVTWAPKHTYVDKPIDLVMPSKEGISELITVPKLAPGNLVRWPVQGMFPEAPDGTPVGKIPNKYVGLE